MEASHRDTPRVLLVDDRPENLLTLEAVLAGMDVLAVPARSGEDALRQVLRHEFALILLDVNMPGLDGLETAALIRQRPSSARTPIIFLTADVQGPGLRDAYSLGAIDYLLTPVDPPVLRTKVGVLVDLYRKALEVREQGERLRRAEEELRRDAQAAFRSADERLRRMVESARDYAIFSLDTEGRITSWNLGGQRLFEYTEAEVVGETESVLFAPGERCARESPMHRERAAAAGRSERDCRFRRRDGSEFVGNAVLTPIHADTGTLVGFTEVVRDVTEARRVAAELRESDRRKDEFIAVLAHELRNPLSAISAAAAICRSGELRGSWERAVHVIERQCGRLARLTDDLLDLARLSRGKVGLRMEPLDARAIVAAATEAVRPDAEARGHRLRLELPDEPLPVKGDPLRLEQVVTNLLTNACRYSLEPGEIRAAAAREDDEVVIRVRDQGIGIAREMLDRIFDRFVQANETLSRSSGGLGIGLTVARDLMDLHRGSIAAHSEGEGRGSEFVVRLPLAAHDAVRSPSAPRDEEPQRAAAPAAAARAAPLEEAPRLSRILVCDDNQDSAELLATLLLHWGFQVDVAHDGLAALARIREARPDAALLDIGLPAMDGYEVARRVRAEGLAVLLVAVSGYGQERDRARSREAGFDHHLIKPVDYAALQEILGAAGVGRPAG